MILLQDMRIPVGYLQHNCFKMTNVHMYSKKREERYSVMCALDILMLMTHICWNLQVAACIEGVCKALDMEWRIPCHVGTWIHVCMWCVLTYPAKKSWCLCSVSFYGFILGFIKYPWSTFTFTYCTLAPWRRRWQRSPYSTAYAIYRYYTSPILSAPLSLCLLLV